MKDGISYFNVFKLLSNLEIDNSVLEHLAEVENSFDAYLKKVFSYGKEDAMTFLTLELYNELLYSNQIEEAKILPPSDILRYNLVSIGKYLTNKKICQIQEIFLENVIMPYPKGEYRTVPVFINHNGDIIYYAPNANAVPDFMADFIKFYNKINDNLINNNPFIKASLIHLLFVKIHPFVDGNGRVARILHNIKFTDLVNQNYAVDLSKSLDLKLAPVNISYSIFNNRQSYYDKLGKIDFNENSNCNFEINRWIDFLLYMYEEQLFYYQNSSKIKNLNDTLKRIRTK